MALPSGISIDELDPGVRPQDDLFRHVNGRWLARTEIPADRARYGSFPILAEAAETAVREIVEEAASAPAGSEERKFGDLYASFMDAERAEQLRSVPVHETGVQVAELPLLAAFRCRRGLFHDLAHRVLSLFSQNPERALARPVGGDLGPRNPPAVDVQEQVVLRADAGIELVDGDTG